MDEGDSNSSSDEGDQGNNVNGGHSSLRSVIWALGGNLVVMTIKYVAGFMIGSGALISEANHRAADVCTQISLLIGILRGSQKPSKNFPFGYGRERYLWNLFAVLIMGGLAAFTLQGAIKGLMGSAHADYLTSGAIFTVFGYGVSGALIAIGVLAIAGIIEFRTFLVAREEVWAQKDKKTLLAYYRDTTDPTALAVLSEDFFAVIGVAVAIAGIALAFATRNPIWDTTASFLIFGFMVFNVVVFGLLNWILLVGRSHEETEEEVEEILGAHPAVEKYGDVQAIVFGVKNVVVRVRVEPKEEKLYWEILNGEAGKRPARRILDEKGIEIVLDELDDLTKELEALIRAKCPQVREVIVEVDHLDEEVVSPV